MIVKKEFIQELKEELQDTKLIAATKYVGMEEIKELEKAGVMYFGENRVQALLEKYEHYHGKGVFHMIGTLQKNKVKYIIDKVEFIHSVDTISLIKEIEKQAKKHHRIMKILLQVNISHEESKHGFDKKELDEAFELLKQCNHIQVRGLMMMAPYLEANKIEKYFKETKELLEELKIKYPNFSLTELSMGMSNDYKIALKYGSTMVRIGSALFEK